MCCFWYLQENHYRPPDQDTCLPCDCFPHGSHSRACDMDTGQCACKPGVIGRQCNRCDNPFAEVTTLGCEGSCRPLTLFGPRHGDRGCGYMCVSAWAQHPPGVWRTLSCLVVSLCPFGPLWTWPCTTVSLEPGSPPTNLTLGGRREGSVLSGDRASFREERAENAAHFGHGHAWLRAFFSLYPSDLQRMSQSI